MSHSEGPLDSSPGSQEGLAGTCGPRVRLLPVLGLATAAAIVVGEVIGSGVFIAPREVAHRTGGSVGLILTLWLVCGLVNLCGALTLAELSAMFPEAGGTYVFLREAYGRPWAFLWGWAEFLVIRSGSIAALAVAMTISLAVLVEGAGYDLSKAAAAALQTSVAVGAIAVLAFVNIVGTRFGGAVQNVTTVIKVGFVAFLAVLPFIALRREPVDLTPLWPASGTWTEWDAWKGIGAALALIMFAYDGWGNVTVVAEEIKEPQRNIPRALAGGVVLLIVLYMGANLAYHLTLSSERIAGEAVPAAAVAETLLPGWGEKLTLSMLMISIFGALNGNILAGPRVLFAVGRDNAALSVFRRVDPRFKTPALAIFALSLWAIILILAGGLSPYPDKRLYEVLVDYVIFGGSLFYLAAVVAVFVFRWKRPDMPRPYRAWGYPIVPAVFVLFYVYLLISLCVANPRESGIGLGLIASGMVVYVAQKAAGSKC